MYKKSWVLSKEDLAKVREVFLKNKHLRFVKHFCFHQPYGKGEMYKEAVQEASLEQLTKLIGTLGMLLQTKVYVFWQRSTAAANTLIA